MRAASSARDASRTAWWSHHRARRVPNEDHFRDRCPRWAALPAALQPHQRLHRCPCCPPLKGAALSGSGVAALGIGWSDPNRWAALWAAPHEGRQGRNAARPERSRVMRLFGSVTYDWHGETLTADASPPGE